MKFNSLRSSLIGGVFALLAALLLGSCGGGGAATSTAGGQLGINPTTGTAYGGIPFTFSITGGRAPYTLTSSEPGLLSVPAVVNGNSVTVIPNNPGVVNIGLQPGELPVRSVNISVRDNLGASAASTIQVGQNFLSSYGISFSSSSCPPPATGSTTTSVNPCSGGDTIVTLQATFNGNLAGDRQFRLIKLGNSPYIFVVPATGVSGESVVVTSDHTGTVTAIVRVSAGAPTQVAVLRVQDVLTGVYSDHAFVISGATSNLTAIPNQLTFTGALSTQCGTGQADFLVFDGVPPYRAISSNPNIVVTPAEPAVSPTNPGRFTVTANNPSVCVTATIIVQDSLNSRTLVTVTTAAGSGEPAPTPVPLVVAPNTITLGCGQSGSVSIIGGGTSTTPATTYSASSPNPSVTTTVSGNTLTITRAGPAPGSGTPTTIATITVTDGTQTAQVTVNGPPTCP